MKRDFLISIIACALLLCSCGPARHTAISEVEKVIIREEVKTIPVVLYDTIPDIRQAVTVKDTTSYLENDLAASGAVIQRDGTLFHWLDTKPQERPVMGSVTIVQHDTLTFREKAEVKEVEKLVERKLTWWQRFRLDAFFPLLLIALGSAAYALRRILKLA